MQRTNTMAVVSLVAGIISWVGAPLVAGIVAIICGHVARKQIKASYGGEGGDGLAMIGLVLGYINVIGAAVGVVILLFMFFGLACLGVASSAGAG